MNSSLTVLSTVDYHQLFNKNPNQQLILKADSPYYTIIDANEAFMASFCRSKDELVGRSIFSVLPENKDEPSSYTELKRCKDLDFAVSMKTPLTLSDYRFDVQVGSNEEFVERYWTCIYTPILSSDEVVDCIMTSTRDVTDKHIASRREIAFKKAIKNEREQVSSLFMQAPLPLCILKGPNYIIELINEPLCLLYGKSHAELIGKPIFEVLPEARNHGYEEIMAEVIRTGIHYKGMNAHVPLLRNGVVEDVYFNFVYEPYREDGSEVTGLFVIGFEVTEEVRNKQKLEESEAKFRFMAESLPQQVWSANAEGTVDFVNKCTSTYFGKPDMEAGDDKWKTGAENWFEYIHRDDLSKCIDAWLEATKTGESFQTEFRLLRADDTYRWHLSMAVPFKADDKIVKWLGTNTDIEEFKQLEVRKDEFISIASHELKTPMTSLKGYIQLLSTNSLDELSSKYIDRSLNQIYRIEKLISDLLDVSKITSGKISYDRQNFDFKSLLTDTVQNIRLTNLKHAINIEGNVSAQIFGDRDRIEQVLINFLTNAIKYSPKADQILIKTIIENQKLVVSIQDFGIGIGKSHHGRLFDRFYRVDNTAMFFPGLGLGLYVSAEIIERHAGSYWYESEPEKGSIFYFSLPLLQKDLTGEISLT